MPKKVSLSFLALALCAQTLAPLSTARAQTFETPKAGEQIRGVRETGTRGARVSLAELGRQEALNPDDSYAVPRAIPAPKPAPEEPPGPESDALSASTSIEAEAPQALGASPAATGFLGSEDSVNDGFRSIPPDTHGAVGPNHLVVTHNGRVRVQTKTGQTLSTVGLKTFWSRLFPGKSLSEMDVFDPKVLYDPYGGRFMITSCADRNKPESAVLVGVTQTSDPTGNWFLYSADADPADLTWADFPSMGFNKNWIVVQMNMFAVAAGTSNAGKFFVFDKAQLYAGPSSIGVNGITVPTSGFTMAPAATYDPNLETLYVLQRWNGASGSLRVSAINNVGGIPTLNTALSFPQVTNFTWQSTGAAQSDFAPQQGSAQKIQTNDDRMHGVVYRNGSLWCAHTVFTPRGAPTRSVIQWWEVDPSVSSGQFTAPRQRGLVDPSGTDFYAFPSIAVNRHNDVLVGYSRFGANRFASANYSFRAGTDPANSLRDDAVLKAGEAHYYKTFGGTENRWGDYSATTVDPANDTDLWTLQEYAAARAGSGANDTDSRWGTWWGKVGSGTPADEVAFTVVDTNVAESAGRIDLIARRTGAAGGAASVDYATSNLTASELKDYNASFGTLRFAAGETEKTVSVFITNDRYVEPSETFLVRLSNPVGCSLGTFTGATVNILSDDAVNGPNPVDWSASFDPAFFVRQQYVDFLGREPDADGLAFWSTGIINCGTDAACAEPQRVNVSAAFYLSIEFQETGYLVYRTHKAAYGNLPGASVPVRIGEFLPDQRRLGEGVQVGIGAWQQQLEANKAAYASDFVARAPFTAAYPSTLSHLDFVNRLNANANGALSPAERDQLVNSLAGGAMTRAQVLRRVAEDADFAAAEKSRAFVMMQYMGYLRRDPDAGGYLHWLQKLDDFGGDFNRAEMVKAFITSIEYKERFGP
ncbi:MAG TPA: DUF4214 domain-containing protein [Pyrinomonadaceae bacterium]|nr:DUF4214 domain-containing protein [Pyrinomonadaceae bacterium]